MLRNIALITTLLCFLFRYGVGENDKNHTFSFEIKRHRPPIEHYLNHRHHFDAKFRNQIEKPSPSPRDNDSIALYRFIDDQFYGEIVIGHPGQKLNVAFDTTWSLSWVMSSKCSSILTIGCYFHNKYDHSKSSEYRKDGRPFAMDLGKYNLTGIYSYDNISIAHSNATNQSFVEMVNVPYEFLFNKADGVMGLGLKVDSYDPFFYTLLNEKKIKNSIFSIYLNRDRQSNRGGNVMLGFVNPKHIHKTIINNKPVPDNFTYLSVENYAYWQFQMDQVVVKMTKDKTAAVVCEKGCKAIVDTSSNSIVGPQEDIATIHDVINAREFILHRYTVDCDTVNKLPKIDFMLGGKNFTLSGPDYTVKMSLHSVTLCFSAFVPAYTAQEVDRWILGGAFLAKFYTVYDVQARTIGFVQAN